MKGRKSVGHPVDVASGTFYCAWHDIEIGGQTPLVFRRYFSTSLVTESLARLGPGWTHNFAITLLQTSEGYRLRDQNGGVIDFPTLDDVHAVKLLNKAASMELRAKGDTVCLYHWHDWRTSVEKLWFQRLPGGQFRLEKISSPSGFGLVLAYDAEGRLLSVTQMIEGRQISFRYNQYGLVDQLLVQSRSSNSRVFASYLYDRFNRLVEVRDACGASIRYTYDNAGRIVREQTRSGAVFQMLYDIDGRCVSTSGTDGYHACSLQYLIGGRVTLVTNSVGNVTVYEFNGSGQVVKEIWPNGGVFLTHYDEFGRIVEEVNSLAFSTRYRYDTGSNTTMVVYPNGLVVEACYDGEHQPTLVRQGEFVWRFAYASGQLISVVDPRGMEEQYRYDSWGFLSSIIELTDNTVRIEPDESWTRVRLWDDYGFDNEDHYDDLMHITQSIEADGGVYRFDSDEVGRLIRASVPGSPLKEYRYDDNGYLASATDEDGYTVHLRHNAHGLLEQILTPTGRVYTCTWDTEGRLKEWVNPSGERAEFEYDVVGNQTQVRHFDGRLERWEFDVMGRAVRNNLSDGTVLFFDYDISGNLIRIHSGGVDLIISEYDIQGRLVRTSTPGSDVYFEYDSGFRIAAEIQNGRRVEYKYNRFGMLTARTFSGSPLPPLELEWDRRLRLLSARRGHTLVHALSYDSKDQCIERRFGNCVERLEYDVSGVLIAQTVLREKSIVVSRSWAYDGRRNVVGINDLHSGERRYQFDGDHRLVESWSNGLLTHYRYNPSGNLIGWEGDRRRQFQYGGGGQLVRSGTRTYERDANGRVTRIIDGSEVTSLRWDALGQLTEVGHPDGSRIKYAYDGLGRRLSRNSDGANTEYVWAGEQPIAEVSGGLTSEYLFDGFRPTVVWRGEKAYHLINSHLGVPHESLTDEGVVAWSQRLSDWGGLEYDEGGGAGRVPFRFPGQYADNGLYYNRFRYYDPRGGQYLSPDPLGLGAGANEYVYCPNPINWMDVFGLSCGIPPGQHSVYVLQNGPPPSPPAVIYVGITRQSPHARLAQHRARPPGGVTPDSMRIIATGPPTVPDRVAARRIESSILTHAPQPGMPGQLNNAQRPVNPGYYHSNVPSAAGPGATHLPTSTTSGLLNPTNGTTIT